MICKFTCTESKLSGFKCTSVMQPNDQEDEHCLKKRVQGTCSVQM